MRYLMIRKIIKGGDQFIVVLMTLLVVLSPLTAITTVGATPVPSDETITVTENVSVWDRSILTLRTDTSNADTKLKNAGWYLSHDGETPSLNKSTLGVFNKSDTITIHFSSDDVNQAPKLSGENVTLIAARLTPSGTTNPSTTDSFTDALRLLNTSTVNRNASFTHVTSTQLNSNGHGKFEFNPSQSGEYVFFLASGNKSTSGFAVNNGNLSVTGDATIVGVEHALVHDRPSDVKMVEPRAYRGDNLTFTVNTPELGPNAQHAILVYDARSGFSYQQFILNISNNPSNLSELAANTTLKHSISDVRGVARIEDETGLVSRRKGTTPSVSGVLSFVANNTDREIPDHKVIDAPANGTLNASITVVAGNPSEIEVETLQSWGTSTFRWVHIAVDSDGDIQTNTSLFELDSTDFAVINASINTTPVTTGDSITATATVTNLGNEEGTKTVTLKAREKGTSNWITLNSTDVTVAGGASKTISLTGQLPAAGTYEIELGGQNVGEVTVEDEQTSGGGSGAPGGGTGPVEPPAIQVGFQQQKDGSVVADVRNGRKGATVRVDVPDTQATKIPGASFDSVAVTLARNNAHFTLSISTHTTRPSTVPSDPSNVAVKGYLQVDKKLISNSDIEKATMRFSLDPSQLSEGSSPENVVLLRFHDGDWQELETTFVGKQNGKLVFKAVTPGFSTFAIAEKQPDISVSNADLGRSTIAVGDTVEVSATVTNDGSGQGTYTAKLTVGGEVVKTKQVTVAAGESKTVTFSYTPSETGEYSVAVGDVSAGTLTVTAEDKPDETTTTTEQPPTTDTTTTPGTGDGPGGGGGSGSLIALLLLVLLGGAGGALYYFRDEVGAYLDK